MAWLHKSSVQRETGQEDFMELYHRYAEKVYRNAYMLVRHHHGAEDITQEVFCTLYTKRSSIRMAMATEAWIKKVTINTSINYLRKEKKMIVMEVDSYLLEREGSSQYDIEDEYLTKENSLQLKKIIEELPDPQRVVIVLYYYMDLSLKDIATYLGWPIGTVKSRIQRTKAQLKQRIDQEYTKNGEVVR